MTLSLALTSAPPSALYDYLQQRKPLVVMPTGTGRAVHRRLHARAIAPMATRGC